MANSVLKDYQGPDWPLGFVKVVTPRTPVNIMSVVDPSNNNNPNNQTGANSAEYSPSVYAVWFQGWQPANNTTALVPNTGNVYIMRAPAGGSGNATDSGAVVGVVTPGSVFPLVTTPATARGFSPYRYYLDADTANDGCICTAIGG